MSRKESTATMESALTLLPPLPKPLMLLREASRKTYDEVGMEVMETEHCHPKQGDNSDNYAVSYSNNNELCTIPSDTEDSEDEYMNEFDQNENCKSNYFDVWVQFMQQYQSYQSRFSFRVIQPQRRTHQRQQILTPPLMNSLRKRFPYCKSNDNFWMKYSSVHDGASMHTFLERARGAKYTILAIQTVDNEVFGAFTTEPWKKSWNAFGNGEAFLWKLRNSRKANNPRQQNPHHHDHYSIILLDEIIKLESEIDVYPYSGDNDIIQICNHDKICIGGGEGRRSQDNSYSNSYDAGYGLHIQNDMRHGTTSPCVTFGSPSLSNKHSDGSLFEILNLELWTLTPCDNENDAEQLEGGLRFMEEQRIN